MKKRGLIALIVVAICIAVFAVVWVIYQPKHAPDSTRTTDSLRIKEWSIGLPLSSAITDAYYTYNASSDEVFISTKQLDTLLSHVHGCTSGLHGLYYKKAAASPLSLAEQRGIEPSCAIPANSETEQIGTIQAGIRTAAQAVFAN